MRSIPNRWPNGGSIPATAVVAAATVCSLILIVMSFAANILLKRIATARNKK